MDRIRLKKLVHLANDCVPVETKAFHYFCGRDQSVLSLALPAYKFLFGKHLRLRFNVHTSGEGYMSNLKKLGLHMEKLSYLIGGGFSQDDFLKWLAKRRSVERGQIEA